MDTRYQTKIGDKIYTFFNNFSLMCTVSDFAKMLKEKSMVIYYTDPSSFKYQNRIHNSAFGSISLTKNPEEMINMNKYIGKVNHDEEFPLKMYQVFTRRIMTSVYM